MFPKAVSDRLLRIAHHFGEEPLAEKFYLAGGSSLAIQLGHRLSEDLDFFSTDKSAIAPSKIFIERLGGIVKVDEPHTILGEINKVRISFFHLPYPLLEEPINYEGVKLAQLKDILCMKMVAIAQRAEKKDFFDLYELLQLPVRNFTELLEKKYGHPTINTAHIMRSLFYFEEAEESDTPKSLKGLTWSKVKNYLKKNQQQIEARF
jgi:predicted nucleotidyltransferase component of viral defense system